MTPSAAKHAPPQPASVVAAGFGRTGWRAAALLLLACVVYIPSLGNGYIWDDDTFLTGNPLIQAADGVPRFWFSTEAPDYFPLTSTMLWVEWRLWGGHAAGFHAVNILLHAASALLLWRVLLRLRIPGAWLAAALWAVHPVAVESVAWITERKNTLPMLLCLAAWLQWLRAEDGVAPRRSRALALALFVLALLAKTHAVVLAPLLLLSTWWRRGRVVAADVLKAAPYFAVSVVLGLVTVWFQTHNAIKVTVVRGDDLLSRLAIAGRAVWFYLGKALLPVDLAFVYPRWTLPAQGLAAWAPLAALCAAFALTWRFRRTWGRPAFFALACYVVALAPVLGLVDIYFMRYALVADHWQYLALPAMTAAAAAAWSRLARGALRGIATPLAVLVLAALASATWTQQAAYRDEGTLWTEQLRRNPQAWIAHSNLGLLAHGAGRYADAVGNFRNAVAIAPDEAVLHYNLALALKALGRLDEAQRALEECLRLDPTRAAARNSLGSLKLQRGDESGALADFAEALRLDPQLVAAHVNLGIAKLARGQPDEALAHLQAALALRPDSIEALANLGTALQQLGRLPEAIEKHEQVVRLAPQLPGAHVNLGNALVAANRLDEAAAAYEDALRLDPRQDVVRLQLAETLLRLGRPADAFTQYETLVRTDPRALDAWAQMQRIVAQCDEPGLRASLSARLAAARR